MLSSMGPLRTRWDSHLVGAAPPPWALGPQATHPLAFSLACALALASLSARHSGSTGCDVNCGIGCVGC